ncbi:MAG: hypothetical protein IKL52_01340 [Candidatus Gastranaerophilales bacterium]|nr:hypothetical protein [Candidatus Gastranaerophilales bacterium]
MSFSLFKKYTASNLKHEIVEICGIKLKFKNKKFYKKIIENYKNIENKLIEKAKTQKINVTFMVHMASMFPAKPFAKYLLNQENYNVKILITPEYRFGKDNAKKYIDECFEQYKNEFGEENIIVSPIEAQDDNIDLKSFTDILFPAVPYDVTHEKYNLNNIASLGISLQLLTMAFIAQNMIETSFQKIHIQYIGRYFAKQNITKKNLKNTQFQKEKIAPWLDIVKWMII